MSKAVADGSAEQIIRRTESKRRRREWITVVIATATLIAFARAQVELPPLTKHTSFSSNLAVILLFDLSFLLLGLMLFLVARNIAKVIFERRRGLIGSKLQVRLVAAFIAVAIVPSAFLLYVAGAFLRADVDSWFNPEYQRVLDDSMEIARAYYLNSANNATHDARVLAQQISARQLFKPENRADLRKFLEVRQQEYDTGTIEVFSRDRKLLLLLLSPKTPTGIGVSPDSQLLKTTLTGTPVTRTDPFGKADVIRGTAPIYTAPDSDSVVGALVVDYYLPESLATRAAGISHTFENYFQLRILRQPILRSYILALVLIGLVVVMLSSWFGLYIARGITGPIKLMAEGTQAIASGNLAHQIPPVGDDEIGHLVRSFNQMTVDLRASTAELEQRRLYIETLLRNVSAGVVGLDPAGIVSAINPCAERLLGLRTADVQGRPYRSVFPAPLVQALEDHFSNGSKAQEISSSLKVESGGAETELMMTATPLGDDTNTNLGTVLFFEDVSQIAKIERMEAWREVARRIAHEIKNPLTPIQLSAERLKRQLSARTESEAAMLEDCTRTIIGEVEDLKRLVSEFSAFARLPHLNPTPGDINGLAEETVSTFQKSHADVDFVLSLEPSLPQIAIDREALKRALVNLLDNAVAALASPNHNGDRPRIEVKTAVARGSGVVTLEVCDNGPGIDPRLRTRIFEPYFSTRKGGTGLGLAIVSTIVTDHHGFVRVRENRPRGSRFILEFPVKVHQFVKVSG